MLTLVSMAKIITNILKVVDLMHTQTQERGSIREIRKAVSMQEMPETVREKRARVAVLTLTMITISLEADSMEVMDRAVEVDGSRSHPSCEHAVNF